MNKISSTKNEQPKKLEFLQKSEYQQSCKNNTDTDVNKNKLKCYRCGNFSYLANEMYVHL